jgi:hypothetical protein
MRLCAAGITTLFLLSAIPAIADDNSTWSAMTSIGLNGTWAPACGAATSPTNPKLTFYLGANGHVLRSFDRGPGAANLNVDVDSARVVNASTIQARMRNDDPNWQDSNGTVVDVTIEVANNKLHTLQSVGIDGTQWIKDGVMVKSGNPTPVLEKCSR